MGSRVQKLKSRVVVVAEANAESRSFVCSLVVQLNCVAVPAASVSEVLKMIKDPRVDLVLLDLDLDRAQMGKANTLYEIKQLAPILPVVIMSHVIAPALVRRLCDRGVQSFLAKPVARDQLAVILFRYLL